MLMTKNYFRYHITIDYDKSASACIDLSHVVAKKIIIQLCASALVAKERPVGRMSLQP